MSRVKRVCSYAWTSIVSLGLITASVSVCGLVVFHYKTNHNWIALIADSAALQYYLERASLASYQIAYEVGPVAVITCSVIFFIWGLNGLLRGIAVSAPKIVALVFALFFTLVAASYVQSTPTWHFPAGLGGILGNNLLAWFAFVGEKTGANAIPASWWSWFLYSAVALTILASLGIGSRTFFVFLCKFCYLPGYWVYLANHYLLGTVRWIFRTRPREQKITEPAEVIEAAGEEEEVRPMNLFGSSRHIVINESIPAEVQDESYRTPSLRLLSPSMSNQTKVSNQELADKSEKLKLALEDLGVRGEIVNIIRGPVVSNYEFQPVAGTKISRVEMLVSDLAKTMNTESARLVNLPEKSVFSIELPNEGKETISARELLSNQDFYMDDVLKLAAGKTSDGELLYLELSKLPHLLVAGSAEPGKKNLLNLMLLSLLYRYSPNECKLILIDPKQLELSLYKDIPHLLAPIITDPKKAVLVLRWVVRQMELRHEKMVNLGVRNVQGYNDRVRLAAKHGKELHYRTADGSSTQLDTLPYIVVVIDEIADLMTVAGKDIEAGIQRLAHMARAVGIHMIVATQRATAEVITGAVKANFPARLSFKLKTEADSRTILGRAGAEDLLGDGDMLFLRGAGRPIRAHSATISDLDVEAVTKYLRNSNAANYDYDFNRQEGDANTASTTANKRDPLYGEALSFVTDHRKCTVSLIQRRFQISYNRAARIVSDLEENGVISGSDQVGRRRVLIK